MHLILYYLLAVNLIGAVITSLDKHRAKINAWRIPERTLFLFCIFGGCPGVYFTMRLIHHKTLHKRFMWGIPAIFMLQMLMIGAIWYFYHYGGIV